MKEINKTINGFICIDKPKGPSSFGAIRELRRALGVSKVGHAGTLDPMASGVLVVALGNCTRLLQYLDLEPKAYVFTVAFGKATDTLDAEGSVVYENDVVPTKDKIESVMKDFIGEIEQIPPKYSAIKIDGKRAYQLARNGEEVVMKSRKINIFSLVMTDYNFDEKCASFSVSCSAGTYVRTLAVDMAAAAGAIGHVCVLRRTRVGRFDLSMAGQGENYIISASDAVEESCKIVVDKSQIKEISFGRKILFDAKILRDEKKIRDELIAFDGVGELVAVLKKIDDNYYQPTKVFL